MFSFERLEVWKLAVSYAGVVYDAADAFPRDERFGLTSQLRRAAMSISSNIAEGSGRSTNKEFIRFIEIAYGSLMETVSQLIIARQRGHLAQDGYQTIYELAERVARMLSRLRSSLRDNDGS
jgi:four helix bundle protein